MNHIECKNISFSYDEGEEILKDISFSVEKNETIGLIGANGAGKSTLFRLILGLEKPSKGEIIIDEVKIIPKNLVEIRKKVGYLFQDSDNQLFMNNVEGEISFVLRNYGFLESEIKERAEKILSQLDITNLKEKKIIKLSGGEKKLVSIASILVMYPEILLLDEPTNSLDPRYRRKVIEILNNIECTKIIASHDLEMIEQTCNKVILISKGKIIKIGETKEILSDNELLIQNGL